MHTAAKRMFFESDCFAEKFQKAHQKMGNELEERPVAVCSACLLLVLLINYPARVVY
jgi:hypothetical protein